MSSVGAAPGAAVPVSNARAAASRKNGAKSRGPKTPRGQGARGAKCAEARHAGAEDTWCCRRRMPPSSRRSRAQSWRSWRRKASLQTLLARRVAVAAWRLERADRMEAEVLEFRSYEDANAGLALIRDGNATRSFDTLMRYRGAAMAEFWRALKTLKALQAEQAAGATMETSASRPAARVAHRPEPNEPERGAPPRLDYVMPDPPVPGPTLHEPAAPWLPEQPETGRRRAAGDSGGCRTNPKRARHRSELSSSYHTCTAPARPDVARTLTATSRRSTIGPNIGNLRSRVHLPGQARS